VAQCEYLDRVASVEIPKVQMTQQEYAEKEGWRALTEHICHAAFKNRFPGIPVHLSLQCFGSISSGFATAASDVDLALVLQNEQMDGQDIAAGLNREEIARVLEKALLDAGFGARLLAKTRVPILKVCERPTQQLYNALCEEHQRWNELPDGEKYATATSSADVVEPDGEQGLLSPVAGGVGPPDPPVAEKKTNSNSEGKRNNKWDHVRRIRDGLGRLPHLDANDPSGSTE